MGLRSLSAYAALLVFALGDAHGTTAATLRPSAHFEHAKERVLFSFLGFNGANPQADVTLDRAGNVYGTTSFGGGVGSSSGYGTVFQLTPATHGRWKEHVLHLFKADGSDGIIPTTPVFLDSAGNVYGTVSNGGSLNGGIVYELSPAGNDWTYNIINVFTHDDGDYPASGLTMDSSGNLYGTTVSGGKNGSFDFEGAGVVYKLTPKGNGSWTDTTLHTFNVNKSLNPNSPAGPVLLSSGTFYGTTRSGGIECALGGSQGCGTAFSLTLHPRKLLVLHAFGQSSQDGDFPVSALVQDKTGNLYGVTQSGGPAKGGTIFELSEVSGVWTEKILRTFVPGSMEGFGPDGLLFDEAGNMWGTQSGGGKYGGGVLFEMSPASSGWSYSVVFNFGRNQDAAGPVVGQLARDAAGNFYGATYSGGEDNVGAVYEVTP